MNPFKRKATSGGANGGEYEIPPAGAHAARLVALIQLGTQPDTFDGKEEMREKIFFTWELTDEQNKDGDNFVIGRDYTDSMHESAALRKIVGAWRGAKVEKDEEVDYMTLFSKPCLITLVRQTSRNSGKEYAKIESVGALPSKNMVCPPAKHTKFLWAIGDDINAIPDWIPYVYGTPIRDKIMESQEMKGKTPTNEVNNDDLAEVF